MHFNAQPSAITDGESNMKRLLALSILTCLTLWGCSKEDCPVEAQQPKLSELEAIVIENCRIVQAAVDSFAAGNQGNYYPVDIHDDTSSAGYTLIDLIPEGQLHENPFTNQPMELVYRCASEPGEIGYEPYWQSIYYHYGGNPGYTITGYGENYIIVVLSNLEALEDSVRNNCLLIQQAAEEWARQSYGYYPHNVGVDQSYCANSLLGLLPSRVYLKNPFSKLNTEPVDSRAIYPGETGYVPIIRGGEVVGYRITGVGRTTYNTIIEIAKNESSEDGSVWQNCQSLLWAIDEFADANSQIYPSDIHTDTTSTGETVMDLIPEWMNNTFPENPYTHELDQPVNRRAYYPGETGYEVIEEGGINVGCIVTGVGAEEGVLIFEIALPCSAPCHCLE
jgi:hypothetical protein